MQKHLFLIAIFVWALAGFYPSSHAEETCKIHQAQDILDCVLKQHPGIGQARLASQRDATLQKVARQRINPEAETKAVAGNGNRLDTEMSLLHTLEMGGKRSARIKRAKEEQRITETELSQTKEEVAARTVLTLYRLRQISVELSILGESLHIYKQLVDQLKNRPQRTPEQTVSTSVFELARSEATLRRSGLMQEASSLLGWLELATGLEASQLKKYLPAIKKNWPKMEPLLTSKTSNNSNIEKAAAELGSAKAAHQLAIANVWPSIKLGPALDTTREGNNTRLLYGGRLTIPLPLLSQNSGERKFAALEARRAEQNYFFVQSKTSLERLRQAERYRLALKALEQAHNTGLLNKMHQDIDSQVDKGFIPSTLVIEAHRQIFQVATSRHEQELAAIEALWRLYIIDGKVLDAKI